MPRSKNDPIKRKFAQAINHLSNAIVDVNDVYEQFDQSIQRMRNAAVEDPTVDNEADVKRYQDYKARLKASMMYMVIPREELLKFIGDTWGLDEESIKVYLG